MGRITQGTSTDASDAFIADWSQLMLGVRTQLIIEPLRERYADNGQLGFVAWWRGDCCCPCCRVRYHCWDPVIAMILSPAFCKHGRLTDGCEDCALLAAMERGYRPQPAHTPQTPEHEIAEADLYIDRGNNQFVFVAKGDPIPNSMADLPRLPRTTPAQQPATHDQPAASRKRGG